jgi:hypothetical protein
VFGTLICILLVSHALASPSTARAVALLPTRGKAIPGRYIVVLKPGTQAQAAAAAGITPRYVYDKALVGFAALFQRSASLNSPKSGTLFRRGAGRLGQADITSARR